MIAYISNIMKYRRSPRRGGDAGPACGASGLSALLAGFLLLAGPAPAVAATVGVSLVPPVAFFRFLGDAISDHARSLGDVTVDIEHANDAATQIDQVKSFIDAHVDAIVLLPVDASVTDRITAMAQNAHVPLVYVNNGPRQDWFAGKIALALPNDLIAGRVQMDKIVQMMGEKGQVVIIRGPSTHSAAALRTQGVREVLALHPGITVVEEEAADWDRHRAQDLVTGWLAKGDRINAILANNDEMALGAIAALNAAKIPPGQILVAGVDGTPDGLAAIQAGNMAVTLFQDPVLEGSRALDDALSLARSKAVQQYDWVAFQLVTSKTVQHFVSK